MKRPIPTHDPQTGELNPYYEELTGEKNPMSASEERPTTFNLNDLVGRKFRYNGKYGLSEWTDTVLAVTAHFGAHINWTNWRKAPDQVKLEIQGNTYQLFVIAFRTGHHYEFERCIFIEDEKQD
jgi:hypothetical protein